MNTEKNNADLKQQVEYLAIQLKHSTAVLDTIKDELPNLRDEMEKVEQNLENESAETIKYFRRKYTDICEKHKRLETAVRSSGKEHVVDSGEEAVEVPGLKQESNSESPKSKEYSLGIFKKIAAIFGRLEGVFKNKSCSDTRAHLDEVVEQASQKPQTSTETIQEELANLKTQIPELEQQVNSESPKTKEDCLGILKEMSGMLESDLQKRGTTSAEEQ